jgi:hypothetical protein
MLGSYASIVGYRMSILCIRCSGRGGIVVEMLHKAKMVMRRPRGVSDCCGFSCRAKAYADICGHKIGEVVVQDAKHILCNEYGRKLGDYDTLDDMTRDVCGGLVRRGDLLVTLSG